jgi:hypothetical protein
VQVHGKTNYVSEEYVASIFCIREYAKKVTSIKQLAGRALKNNFKSEDGGNTFLQNVC